MSSVVGMRRIGTVFVAGLAGAIGLTLGGWLLTADQAAAQEEGGRGGVAMSGPRYTVVATEAWNLIVTDNSSDTLYFYTVDEGAEIGSELKLRGSLDLSQVGQPSLTPQKTAAAGGGRRE